MRRRVDRGGSHIYDGASLRGHFEDVLNPVNLAGELSGHLRITVREALAFLAAAYEPAYRQVFRDRIIKEEV